MENFDIKKLVEDDELVKKVHEVIESGNINRIGLFLNSFFEYFDHINSTYYYSIVVDYLISLDDETKKLISRSIEMLGWNNERREKYLEKFRELKEFIISLNDDEFKRYFIKNIQFNEPMIDIYLSLKDRLYDYDMYVQYIEYAIKLLNQNDLSVYTELIVSDNIFKEKLVSILIKYNKNWSDYYHIDKIIDNLIENNNSNRYNESILNLFKICNNPVLIEKLNNNNIQDEYTDMINNNIIELKKYRPELHLNNTVNINLQLLENKTIKKYGYDVIADIFEYDTPAYKTLLSHNEDDKIIDWINYMKENNFYSRKLLHYSLMNFENLSDILYDISNKNLELDNNTLNILIEIIKSGNVERINTIQELLNYDNIKQEKIYSLLNMYNKIDFLKLFGEEPRNNYLNDERYINNLYENKVINEFELASINIFYKIKSDAYKLSDDEFRKKYLELAVLNLDISFTYKNAIEKIRKYYSKKMVSSLTNLNDLEGKDGVKISYRDGKNKKIKVIEFESSDVSILGSFISKGASSETKKAKLGENIINNVLKWNNNEGVSSISTSYYNSQYMGSTSNGWGGGLVFGFTDIPDDSIFSMHYSDDQLSHKFSVLNPSGSWNFTNPYIFAKKCSTTLHNEVGLYRKSSSIKENGGRIQPSCLIASDEWDIKKNLERAEILDIPIVVLNASKHIKRNQENYEKYKSLDITKFDKIDIDNILYYQMIDIDESYKLVNKLLDFSLSKEIIDNDKYLCLKNYLSEKLKEFPTARLSDYILQQEKNIEVDLEDEYGKAM